MADIRPAAPGLGRCRAIECTESARSQPYQSGLPGCELEVLSQNLGALAPVGITANAECSWPAARWACRQGTAARAVGWVAGTSAEAPAPEVMGLFA